MTRTQFWGVLQWTGIQSGFTPLQMRQMRETTEAYYSSIEALLADGDTQGAFDLMSSLGVITLVERPTDLVASQNDYATAVSIAFTDPGSADEYALFRAPAADADDWSAYTEMDRGVASPLLGFNPSPGTEYAYRVVAYDTAESAASLPSEVLLHTALVIPKVVGVAATSVAAPVITWTAVAPAPDGYDIFRDDALLVADGTSGHADATAVAATTYEYRVQAKYLGKTGFKSDPATATTP